MVAAPARRFGGILVVLLGCATAAGCSGKVVERAARSDAGADTGADAGTDLSRLTCDELGARAHDELSRALTTKADQGCQADADCEPTLAGTRCTNGCAPLATRRAVESIAALISKIDGDVCSRFVQNSCQIIEPPCIEPLRLGSCVSGACESIPPASWSELDVTQSSGPCPPRQSCVTKWQLTPDGRLTGGKAGTTGSATLSAGDLSIVDGILRSLSFRRSMANGFGCDPSPTDVSVQLTRQVSTSGGGSEGSGQDVTGCVFSGPKGNDAERLFAVLQKY
jgi:hypothetical protein